MYLLEPLGWHDKAQNKKIAQLKTETRHQLRAFTIISIDVLITLLG
jgi:hypothetical protein